MFDGIRLTLLVGPVVAVPAPQVVVDALTSVQVNTYSGDTPSGFELSFTLSKRSPLHTLFLLTGGSLIPLLRVILIATFNGTPHTLIDGMATHHQVSPGEGGTTTLVVQGKDLTAVMDLIDFSGIPYPAMPPALRVLVVVAKYAWLGVIPLVIPSFVEDLPIPVERIPRHKGKDLEYLTHLARESGYVFYMEPGPTPGTSFAYWGPEIRVGVPQPALNIDMDAHTNVESLNFRFDKEKKELPIVYIHNAATKIPIPIPIPDVTPLNPPLGVLPPLPPKIRPLPDTAKLSPAQALMRGIAHAVQNGDSVFADGKLDVLRYGRVLKSRQLVGVRGAGMAYDGLYYVKSVTHRIQRGQYKQSFSLARNGLISTLPKVPA
jgi:hypothetical protein